MARGIETHNGLVVFADMPRIETRGNPYLLIADEDILDIDASPKTGVTALGTAKVMRLRGNVQYTDLLTGELRVLNIEARAAKNIPVIDCINLEPTVRSGANISGRISAIMSAFDVQSAAGTIAELIGHYIVMRLEKKPTYAAGIRMASEGGQTPHYGIDMGGTYPMSPSTADIRLGMANICILSGSGAPTMAAPKGSLYLRTNGTGVADRAYINTDGSTTWTAISTAA